MALRKFMHPRNKYKQGADFKKLAILYPDFCQHTTTDLSGRLRYNFKNEESLRALTKTLLKHDFNLEVDIPNEKLVPAMPLRLNYILWIEDLLVYAKLNETGQIHGIDIGTGAVCIYPLLCAKTYGWKMTGTEIDQTSVTSANNNVMKNSLDSLIRVIHVKEGTPLLSQVSGEEESYTFTMCNPPFFNADEIAKREKRLPPRNAATGNESELLVEGGEKSFVTRLIDESLTLGERVKIYTTMLGQKSSCAFFRSELKKRNIHNATWTEFCQGHTKRWGLAWTFMDKKVIDLSNAPVIRTRNENRGTKRSKDEASEMMFPLAEKFHHFYELVNAVKEWIRELKIEMKELDITKEEFDGWTCRLRAHEDTWSHARRKRRMALRREESMKKSSCLENSESKISSDKLESEKDDGSFLTPVTDLPLLECSLMLGILCDEDDNEESEKKKENLIKICLLYENGHGGKNALETFRQYLINKLNIRDYLFRNGNFNKSPKKKRKRNVKNVN